MKYNRILYLIVAIHIVGCRQTPPPESYTHRPKNIILMIADGWSYNHIAATDYYQHGRTNIQSYQRFPLHLAISTFMVNGSYNPDSARASFDYIKKKPTDSDGTSLKISNFHSSNAIPLMSGNHRFPDSVLFLPSSYLTTVRSHCPGRFRRTY